MTLDDIDASLPNGFHDAYVERVEVDYPGAIAKIRLQLHVGTSDDPPGKCEARRLAELRLAGLVYWVAEPPHPAYLGSGMADKLVIDVGPLANFREEGRQALPPSAPTDAFENWIFVRNWNAFIYLAAREAALEWCGPSIVPAEV